MIVLTKIISTAIEKGKLIIKILGYGSADVKTVNNILPFGIDSRPIKNYRAIYASTGSKEDKFLIGVLFENSIVEEGEIRFHAEDKDGNEVSFASFKNNGDIELKSKNSAYIKLVNDGNIEVNGSADFLVRFSKLEEGFNNFKQDMNNFITTVFNTHVHPGVTSGGASTGPSPTPGTASSATISASKIDNLKTN